MMLSKRQFMAYCERHGLNSVELSADYRIDNDANLGIDAKLSSDTPDDNLRYNEYTYSYSVVRMLPIAEAYDRLQWAFITPDDMVQAHMRSLCPKRAVFFDDLDELPF